MYINYLSTNLIRVIQMLLYEPHALQENHEIKINFLEIKIISCNNN